MQEDDNGEQAQRLRRPLSAWTHALAQQAGIECQKRGHDDGCQDREVKPEAEDRNRAGGRKQRDRRHNQEDRRLDVSRDGHGLFPLRRQPRRAGRRGTKDVAPTFNGKPAPPCSLGCRPRCFSASNPE
jgi:hypothetical protein